MDRRGSKLLLLLSMVGVFCLGMLASTAISWVRLRLVCKEVRLPASLADIVGKDECLGVLGDIIAVKAAGGVVNGNRECTVLLSRDHRWYAKIDRDDRGEHLEGVRFTALPGASYEASYDDSSAVRSQSLWCVSGEGKGTLYVDGNGDGTCEFICQADRRLFLYTGEGWTSAVRSGGRFWMRAGEGSWYRAELTDGIYRAVGEPEAQVPSPMPDVASDSERVCPLPQEEEAEKRERRG